MFQTSQRPGWQQYVQAERHALRKLRRDSGDALTGSTTRMAGLIVIGGLCLAGWFGTYSLGKFGRLIIGPTVTTTDVPHSATPGTRQIRSATLEAHPKSDASDTQFAGIESLIRR